MDEKGYSQVVGLMKNAVNKFLFLFAVVVVVLIGR